MAALALIVRADQDGNALRDDWIADATSAGEDTATDAIGEFVEGDVTGM